jgi:hypothetical protein
MEDHKRIDPETALRTQPLNELENASRTTDNTPPEPSNLLECVYLAMADAFSSAGIKLTPAIYEEILPDQVLILAAHLGLMRTLDEDSEEHGVRVGKWLVSGEDNDEVRRHLESAINLVSASNKVSVSIRDWEEPTPKQLVDHFLDLMDWQKPTLIDELSDNDYDLKVATKRFLDRLCTPPDGYVQLGIDSRTGIRLKKLVDIMARRRPEEFGTLNYQQLRWRERTSPE